MATLVKSDVLSREVGIDEDALRRLVERGIITHDDVTLDQWLLFDVAKVKAQIEKAGPVAVRAIEDEEQGLKEGF